MSNKYEPTDLIGWMLYTYSEGVIQHLGVYSSLIKTGADMMVLRAERHLYATDSTAKNVKYMDTNAVGRCWWFLNGNEQAE